MELKKTLNNILDKIKENKIGLFFYQIYEKLKKTKYVPFFFFMYSLAFITFFVTLIKNQFTLPIAGDFTLQEIPFYFNGYDDWWTFFKTGQFVLWDDSGMLGVNNIGANSFYYLFNPFFIVLLIVPRFLMPQAQAFMMITKMVLAGFTMKLLLQKFKVKEETTWLIATAYAFCGWNLYYIWFNHFLEIAVLMPLLILGIEKIIKDQKPLTLIMVIFVTGLTNYFFLISFCFCGVIYAIFRYFQNFKEYNQLMKNKKTPFIYDVRLIVIVQGIFAFAVGLMLSAVILIPCFSVALENTRVTTSTYLPSLQTSFDALIKTFSGEGDFFEALTNMFKVLFTWPEINDQDQKNLLYPLIAFFTPNVSCFDSLILAHQQYDNVFASCFIYTPLLLMFVPCIIQSLKKRAVSTIIGLLGIILLMFTPFAYYCFSGFTSVAYARWYIFVTVIACLFIGVQYDKKDEMKMWTLNLSLGVVVIVYGFLLYKSQELTSLELNNLREIDERTLYIYGQLVYILILYLYLRKNYKKEKITYDLRYVVALEVIVMTNITLMVQGTVPYQTLYHGSDNISHEMSITQKLKREDESYFRLFSTTADRDGNNLAMMYGTGGIGTFHSVYNYELDDFLSWSQVTYNGSWSMGVHEKRVYLDEFLGIKYYLVKQGDTNIPFGFSKYFETDTHVVYKNDNFIELGFVYDEIMDVKTIESFVSDNSIDIVHNEKAYLSGAILYEDDYQKIQEKYNFNVLTRYDIDNEIYSPNLQKSDVKVYRAIWPEDSPYFEWEFETPVNYSYEATKNLTWCSYMDIDVSDKGIGSECSTRGKCFITVQARMGENLNITLYGENDKVLANDIHMAHYYDKTYDSKKQRGFYVNEEVKRIKVEVVETMNNDRYLLFPYISYQYEDSYNNIINSLKENKLENIKKGVNDFSFDTKFEDNRIVVLQIPYDKGWHLKDNNQEVEILKAQGGFISFISEKGNHHYVLEYKTPYLKEGMIIMSIGTALLGAYYIAYQNINFNKKRYEEMFRIN